MLPPQTLEKMSLRIVFMLMQENEPDTYRIAEHCKRYAHSPEVAAALCSPSARADASHSFLPIRSGRRR